MTPLRCGTQVEPPSVVRRIVPPSPTAVPVLASLNQTLRSNSALPAESGVQDVPPVDVPTVIPNAPRATPVEALPNDTPSRFRLDWPPLYRSSQVLPPSNDSW